MFKNTFSIEGRINRTVYQFSWLLFIIITFCIELLIANFEEATLLVVCLFPLCCFIITQGIKRCHDLGCSGWYQLLPFFIFRMMFSKGTRGTNFYGKDTALPESIFDIDQIGGPVVD